MRQGTSPRGIIGLGVTTSEPATAPHYDSELAAAGKTARFVEVRFDALAYPYGDGLLPIDNLPQQLRDGVNWGTQASGISISEELVSDLEDA